MSDDSRNFQIGKMTRMEHGVLQLDVEGRKWRSKPILRLIGEASIDLVVLLLI